MDEVLLRQRLLTRFGVRIEPEMSRYLLRKLSGNAIPEALVVIGGQARTGKAIQQDIPAKLLVAADGAAPRYER